MTKRVAITSNLVMHQKAMHLLMHQTTHRKVLHLVMEIHLVMAMHLVMGMHQLRATRQGVHLMDNKPKKAEKVKNFLPWTKTIQLSLREKRSLCAEDSSPLVSTTETRTQRKGGSIFRDCLKLKIIDHIQANEKSKTLDACYRRWKLASDFMGDQIRKALQLGWGSKEIDMTICAFAGFAPGTLMSDLKSLGYVTYAQVRQFLMEQAEGRKTEVLK
jgi:hypothetical protein